MKNQAKVQQQPDLLRDGVTYDDIVEHGTWLEDRGNYARYWIGGEESVWVNEVTEEIADPDDEEWPEDDDDERSED